MNAIELVLARQRLQIEAANQRVALVQHIAGMQPLFDAANQVQRGWGWLRGHPEVAAGSLAVLAVTRPATRRFLWRWARRAYVGWRLWRDGQRWLHKQA
jgi:hypothetical protein